jgi:flavin-dependent dehydrogenase
LKSEPFSDGRKSIGVGESIGTVYPLLGEGIIPSTICADLFVNNLNDFKTYRKQVLKHFDIYPLVFKFILMKITGTFNLVKNSLDLLRIYHHMKNNQHRYGMEVKIADMMKVSSI